MSMRKLLTFIIFNLSAIASVAQADEMEQIINGGRLYDAWWIDAEKEKPLENHPAYPAEGHKKQAETWRCKECHGWDYRGKDGRYYKGGHYTGIKGIKDKAGKDVKSIVKILKNKKHQFGNILSDDQLTALAMFVSKGQVDVDNYIDNKTKKAKGDATNGQQVYHDNCERCHGAKGTDIGLADKAGIKAYIGDIANENPWETLHKIRFGHPGSKMGMAHMATSGHDSHHDHQEKFNMGETMPPMFGKLNQQQEVDLLRYLQTLTKAADIRFF